MTTQTQLPQVHPVRLPTGQWGVQSTVELQPGARAECITMAGKRWIGTIVKPVGRNPWGYLYTAVKPRTRYKLPRSARR